MIKDLTKEMTEAKTTEQLASVISFVRSLIIKSIIAITPLLSSLFLLKAAAVSGGGGGAALCAETSARTVTPVPAMPPGAAVGAKVPPFATVILSSSDNWRFGGALYSFGL